MSVSLRRRLLVILSLLLLLAWVGSALITGWNANRVLMQQVDRQLQQQLDLVGYITGIFSRQYETGAPLDEPLRPEMFQQGPSHALPIVVDSVSQSGAPQALNVWLSGKLIAVLDQSPRFPHPTADGFGYRDLEGGGQWRVLSRYDAHTELWLLVGVEVSAARRSVLLGFGRALLPLLIILPLTVLLLYLGVKRGLLPVEQLAGQISDRNPRALDPVPGEDVPAEIKPVVHALNGLLERLALALESEQRFTANAAHELRTPLAAIKTEVQLCQRQVDDERSRRMLERIAVRVDRAAHTVEQLLTLARLDPEAPLPMSELDLASLVEEALADHAHLAAARQLRVESALAAARVRGNEEALAILLNNLLVNAFRYADEGSEVKLSLRCESAVRLAICNRCATLSKDEFTQLGKRFYRVPGSAGLGAGLGLSIVSRIAEQHGARFRVGPGRDGRGFCARLDMERLQSGA